MTLSDIGHGAGPGVDDAQSGPASGTPTTGDPHPKCARHALSEGHKAIALVLSLTAGLSLVLALFVSIAVNSGPNGVRLAVAGPAPAVEQIKGAVAQVGADAFDVTVVS